MWYRQGEILFERIDVPKEAVKAFKQKLKRVTNNVIREGEVSGHMHEVVGEGELLQVAGDTGYVSWNEETKSSNGTSRTEYKSFSLPQTTDMFISEEKTIEIKHPEHGSLKLPKGEYRVVIQQEYDELQNINVAD